MKALNYETSRLRRQSDMFSSVLAISPDGRVVTTSPLNFIPSGTSLNVAPEQLQAVIKGPFVSDPLPPIREIIWSLCRTLSIHHQTHFRCAFILLLYSAHGSRWRSHFFLHGCLWRKKETLSGHSSDDILLEAGF